jgi:hypothetical protein
VGNSPSPFSLLPGPRPTVFSQHKVETHVDFVLAFNVGIGLTFLGKCCSTRQELYFQLFVENDFGR